ncbi:hypothetical protein V1525DRAFT_341189, partial [Lipomyces kononenkoae]
TQNQCLWARFDVSALPGKQCWPRKGKGLVEDRENRCTRTNWRTTDSARATSTSNMRAHLLAKHGIFLSGSEISDGVDMSGPNNRQSSFYQKHAETNAAKLLEQSLVRWIVTDDMAFNTIESVTFQQIFRDLGIRSTHA